MAELYSLTWLPGVLHAAGLEIIEEPGWQTRGHGDVGTIRGVLCHHTATPKDAEGDLPTLKVLVDGRSDLAGPLCNLGLSRAGIFHVIAAGRAYHAGAGAWQGITYGNTAFVGIEAENSGLPDDPWPEVQMDAYARGCAAILKHIGQPAIMCAGHKEFALPKGRKDDPSFSMPDFRTRVAAILEGAGQ